MSNINVGDTIIATKKAPAFCQGRRGRIVKIWLHEKTGKERVHVRFFKENGRAHLKAVYLLKDGEFELEDTEVSK